MSDRITRVVVQEPSIGYVQVPLDGRSPTPANAASTFELAFNVLPLLTRPGFLQALPSIWSGEELVVGATVEDVAGDLPVVDYRIALRRAGGGYGVEYEGLLTCVIGCDSTTTILTRGADGSRVLDFAGVLRPTETAPDEVMLEAFDHHPDLRRMKRALAGIAGAPSQDPVRHLWIADGGGRLACGELQTGHAHCTPDRSRVTCPACRDTARGC